MPKKSKKVIYGLGLGESLLQKSIDENKSTLKIVDQEEQDPTLRSPLAKSILNVLNGPNQIIERKAFETDPTQINNWASVYKAKLRLVPDVVLKRIAIQDSLVATVVRTRQFQFSIFGRPRVDRSSCGFIYKPATGYIDSLTTEEKIKFTERVAKAVHLLSTCGHTDGQPDTHQSTLSEWFALSGRDAVVNGRIATEIVNAIDGDREVFHHFVHTDAGTIYKATNDKTAQDSVRESAFKTLCDIAGHPIQKEDFDAGKYAWVQVIDGTPRQVFTDQELKCKNFYPVGNVELDGYPVTPIDTVITAITTHINIVTHNKLYFQSGRATRGMLVIKSDDVDDNVINNLKQQFNNSINSVSSSWRLPVFGCPTDSEITWAPIDNSGQRDMEFQYLTDMNAREILSAFMMSPDELPGWTYLSKGTNQQSLNEGKNEWRLTAARDVGLRPLLVMFEDFINENLFPLIDSELAKKGRICLVGLDAKDQEQETKELADASQVWATYDDILQKVEKPLLGKQWLANLPLNPVYKSYLDAYFTVGEILEFWGGREGASQDPNLAYRRDAFFMQWQQILDARAQPAGPQGGSPEGVSPGGNLSPDGTTNVQGANQEEDPHVKEFGSAVDQAHEAISKSEKAVPAAKRRLLAQHQKTVEFFLDGFDKDAKEAIKEIKNVALKVGPRA